MHTSLGAAFDFAVLNGLSRNNEKARQIVKAVRFPMARNAANDCLAFCRTFTLWRSFDFHMRFSPLFIGLRAAKSRASLF
jgi:hypothetical protein